MIADAMKHSFAWQVIASSNALVIEAGMFVASKSSRSGGYEATSFPPA
jgi:hypothetical protein